VTEITLKMPVTPILQSNMHPDWWLKPTDHVMNTTYIVSCWLLVIWHMNIKMKLTINFRRKYIDKHMWTIYLCHLHGITWNILIFYNFELNLPIHHIQCFLLVPFKLLIMFLNSLINHIKCILTKSTWYSYIIFITSRVHRHSIYNDFAKHQVTEITLNASYTYIRIEYASKLVTETNTPCHEHNIHSFLLIIGNMTVISKWN
jgi:hypothetical protein